MDLNELLFAHQLEVMKASAAEDEESRQHHFDKVSGYAEAIKQLRALPKTGSPTGFPVSRETLSYGTYAGSPDPIPRVATLDRWEDEGGSVSSPDTTIPLGITVTLRLEYHVGRYVYHDLVFAMAEYERQQSSASFGTGEDG
tara:strand:+ start:620 stop:1045 length:426 start_codon:yes stop_codon:yes gene_type:complete